MINKLKFTFKFALYFGEIVLLERDMSKIKFFFVILITTLLNSCTATPSSGKEQDGTPTSETIALSDNSGSTQTQIQTQTSESEPTSSKTPTPPPPNPTDEDDFFMDTPFPTTIQNQDEQTPLFESQENSGINLKVFFSKNSGDYSGGADDLIVEDIQNAKDTIYLAMYDFTNDKIKDALIDAKDRGVEIQIITDDLKVDDDDYQDLQAEGILILDDNRSDALMHNKFIVIDSGVVWSGSANYTYYSFYRNSENLVKIEDSRVADAYIEQFEELKNHQLVQKSYKIDNLEIFFSPEDHFEEKLIELIDNATTSLKFLIFTFTDQEIADALLRAKERGVEIYGVFDKDQDDYQEYSKYDYLLENGLDVKLYSGDYKLHDKVIIIDNHTVVTGSYNFTESANSKNSENSLIIYDEDISQNYIEEFDKIYQEAKDAEESDSN